LFLRFFFFTGQLDARILLYHPFLFNAYCMRVGAAKGGFG